MRFGCEIDHGTRLMLDQQAFDQSLVTDVTLNEDMTRITLQGRQVFQIARVGELVKVKHGLVAGA